MSKKKKTIPVVGILVLCGAFIGVSVAGLTCFVGAAQEHADKSCTELCEALGHKKVKMTDLGCVCEDPNTQERKVHTGPLETVR